MIQTDVSFNEKLSNYINNAPPQDHQLVQLIKQSLSNLDKNTLSIKFKIDIKASLDAVYDSPAILLQKIKRKQHQ